MLGMGVSDQSGLELCARGLLLCDREVVGVALVRPWTRAGVRKTMFLHSRIADTKRYKVRRMDKRLKSSSGCTRPYYVFVLRRYRLWRELVL